MSGKIMKNVAGISLNEDKPTNIALHRLFGWVIWQFPQPQKKGFLGAVRAPGDGQTWLPAVIQADKERVQVFGNAPDDYSSPEQAVTFFQNKAAD